MWSRNYTPEMDRDDGPEPPGRSRVLVKEWVRSQVPTLKHVSGRDGEGYRRVTRRTTDTMGQGVWDSTTGSDPGSVDSGTVQDRPPWTERRVVSRSEQNYNDSRQKPNLQPTPTVTSSLPF